MGKREDILTATRDLVVEEGLPALSYSKIFEKADVGAGTVYHYFSSKEVLLGTLYSGLVELMDNAVLERYDAAAPLSSRFHELLGGVARFALTRPRDLMFLHACSHASAIPAEWRRPMAGVAEALRVFEEGRNAGQFAALPAMAAVAIVVGAVTNLADWVLAGKVALEEGLVDGVVEACWRAWSLSDSILDRANPTMG